ncbi:MAG: hypothetical protein AAF628_20145 [Planctomycetota bacterium]
MVAIGAAVLFMADDGSRGLELWRTDGRAAGTHLVTELVPGPGSAQPNRLVQIGSRAALFGTTDGVWRTDGTASGTAQLAAGFASTWSAWGTPEPAVVLSRGVVLFAADDGQRGRELWRVDPGATAQSLGFGCGATLLSEDPVIGTTVAVTGTAQPGATGALLLSGIAPPIRLGGAPCQLVVDPGTVAMIAAPTAPAGSWRADLPLPNAGALIGVRAAVQAVFAGSALPPGADLTGGSYWTLGL